MWDLWWTERHWGRSSPCISVSSVNHSTDCSTLIIHHQPGFVVESVQLHPERKTELCCNCYKPRHFNEELLQKSAEIIYFLLKAIWNEYQVAISLEIWMYGHVVCAVQVSALQGDDTNAPSKESYQPHMQKQTNSVALVRERTLPAERPPLVWEVGRIR
jgi:hypothetical protein